MKKNMTVWMAVMLALLLTSGWAGATVILDHEGSSSPTTEGFYYAANSVNGASPTVGAVSDGGVNAWQINTMAQESLYAWYENDSTMGDQAVNLYTNGWTLTVKARVVQTYMPGPDNGGASLSLIIGGLRYNLGLNLDSTGTPTNTQVWTSSGTGTVYNLPGGSIYHTYQLTALPESVNPHYYASLYIDGQLVESNIKSIDSGSALYFGDAASSSSQITNTYWSQVKLETPPVPEPATLSLLMMGLVGLGLRKRS